MASQDGSTRAATPRPRHSGGYNVRSRRYEPTSVYALAERLKRTGAQLQNARGPWRPTRRALRRPGRNAESAIPVVTNGVAEIAVDTAEHAVDLSGFLNWCGVDHLEPVANLRPPEQDLTHD
jgi:hypothetical protein